jgi:hypothetical protein
MSDLCGKVRKCKDRPRINPLIFQEKRRITEARGKGGKSSVSASSIGIIGEFGFFQAYPSSAPHTAWSITGYKKGALKAPL